MKERAGPDGRYFVYMVTTADCSSLDVGTAGDLRVRMYQMANRPASGNAPQFLVYWESFTDVWEALKREKIIAGYSRSKKKKLIDAFNPTWDFLNSDMNGEGYLFLL